MTSLKHLLDRPCDVCGENPPGRFACLNRFVLINKDNHRYTEPQYVHDNSSPWDVETGNVIVWKLCYPGCLHTYLELKFTEMEIYKK